MQRFKKIMSFLVVALLITAAFTGGIAWKSNRDQERLARQTQMTSAIVESKLLSAKELITTKYQYTNVGSFEDQTMIKDWKIPFTKKKFVVKYDGLIQAGIDLNQTEINVKNKQIVIKLPKSKILAHELNEKSMTVFDEDNNLFNPIEVSDYKTFASKQKSIVEQQAISKGLLSKADKEAQSAIRLLLNQDSLTKDYQIIFK